MVHWYAMYLNMTHLASFAYAKVYEILNTQTGLRYIGSTCQRSLENRLRQHLTHHNDFLQGKTRVYISSSKVFEGGEYVIQVLEHLPGCQSKGELLMRERHYVETLSNVVNLNKPGRGPSEYYRDNVHKFKEGALRFVERNPDYYRNYFRNNRDKFREYYQAKRASMLAKVTCECGAVCARSSLAVHMRSSKHARRLANHQGGAPKGAAAPASSSVRQLNAICAKKLKDICQYNIVTWNLPIPLLCCECQAPNQGCFRRPLNPHQRLLPTPISAI